MEKNRAVSKETTLFWLNKSQSALGELGRATGSLQAVLLALLHARIAGEVAGLLDGGLVLFVCLDQRAGDAVTDRARLAGEAAALAVDEHVILAQGVGQNQRLTNDGLEGFVAEILLEVALIDDDIALAGNETNASDRLFSSANGVEASTIHVSSSSQLQLELNGLLGLLIVLGASVNKELLGHLVAEGALGQHSANRLAERELALVGHQLAIGDLLESACVAGVIVVDLLIQLLAGKDELVGVDDDDVVAAVAVGGEGGLMLSAKHGRHLRSQTAENHTLSVDHVPLTLDVLGIRHISTHV